MNVNFRRQSFQTAGSPQTALAPLQLRGLMFEASTPVACCPRGASATPALARLVTIHRWQGKPPHRVARQLALAVAS